MLVQLQSAQLGRSYYKLLDTVNLHLSSSPLCSFSEESHPHVFSTTAPISPQLKAQIPNLDSVYVVLLVDFTLSVYIFLDLSQTLC